MGFIKRSSYASLVAGGWSGATLTYGVLQGEDRLVTGELLLSLQSIRADKCS